MCYKDTDLATRTKRPQNSFLSKMKVYFFFNLTRQTRRLADKAEG